MQRKYGNCDSFFLEYLSVGLLQLQHGSDVVGVAWRPDGKQMVSSTMNGQIAIWEWPSGRQTGSIEGRRDIAGGRLEKDKVTAAHSASTKCFTSLCYTADGSCLLAGGRTKYGVALFRCDARMHRR